MIFKTKDTMNEKTEILIDFLLKIIDLLFKIDFFN
jgi:hypothetical protein